MAINSILLGLTNLVPSIKKWLKIDSSGNINNNNVMKNLLNLATQITGTEKPEDILTILKSKPELLIQFQRDVCEYDLELEINHLKDIQNARNRDLAFIRSGNRNVRADIMVISAALGLLSCLIALAYYQGSLPGEAVGIISTVAGIFGSCLKDAYSFEFGSSRGSKAKEAASLIKNMQM